MQMKNKKKSNDYGERNNQRTIYLAATKNIFNAQLSHTSSSIEQKSLSHHVLKPSHLWHVDA
jgi:hypothetical protein